MKGSAAAVEDVYAIAGVRRPRLRRAAIGFAIMVGLFVSVAWLARVPIVSRFVDRTLAANHVPAAYTIADLGFGRQRLEHVVLGDPAHPDLVADWVETRTDIGVTGPRLIGVRAGQVRLRGRLIDGRLSLGAVDRLLPAPSGKPFALPAIALDVADARMRLETRFGTIGLRLAGRGRLDDGFRGTLAAVAERVEGGGCTAASPSAALAISIRNAAPTFAGPVRAERIECGKLGMIAPVVRIDATLTAALDRWTGSAGVVVAALASSDLRAGQVSGTIGFTGGRSGTAGPVSLTATRFAAHGIASGGTTMLSGNWRSGAAGGFTGAIKSQNIALDPALRGAPLAIAGAADGSPLAPLLRALATAADRAAARFAVEAQTTIATAPLTARITSLVASAPGGARLNLRTGTIVASANGVVLNGVVELGGGGLPRATAALGQSAPGGAIAGTLAVDPYAAGDARLALSPVRFDTGGATTHIATVATVSGPLGDGRVEGLRLPIAALWQGNRLAINPACAPLSFERLTLSGLRLDPARVTVCPAGGAVFRSDRGRIGGGARIAATELTGTLGASPLTLALAGAEVSLGNRGFSIRGLAAALGQPDRATHLDFAHLDGRLANGGVIGTFAGGDGRVGKVPLLLSAAAGDWRFRHGALGVSGALTVSDAAASPRFVPLAARDVSLTLAQNRIEATGALFAPATGSKVADVTLAHALASGVGHAALAIPGIAFDEHLQPDQLTRLTYGVIADVKGSVSGDARIDWSPAAVTSTGTFRTANTDLAAAFGPVTGLSTEIRFTDLLNLESAPGQIATVASINPGIPVTDGRIVYRVLPGNRVAVAGAHWPFAGGDLTLEPTLLDFSAEQTRRLTFKINGMDAGRFLQQFDFDNIDATGRFDGTLPILFDASGGRIEGGTLVMRPGGGTIAYVGELSEKDLGFWGNVAFQALRSLRYQRLNVVMNGPLAGEMVTEVKFAGVSQGEGAKSNFLIRRLQKLPFVFNVRIRAPFRGLIDSVRSFYEPERLIERNLPALIEQQDVQPPASAPVPQPKD